jgi:hypothetical protein
MFVGHVLNKAKSEWTCNHNKLLKADFGGPKCVSRACVRCLSKAKQRMPRSEQTGELSLVLVTPL